MTQLDTLAAILDHLLVDALPGTEPRDLCAAVERYRHAWAAEHFGAWQERPV